MYRRTVTMDFTKGTPAVPKPVDTMPAREDHAVLEEVFQRYWKPICVVIYRITGDWSEAEDLALEVFLQFHARPPRDQDRLAGWLYRVATNLGLNALRARKRREGYEAQAAFHAEQDAQPDDPQAVFEHAQERERVRITLAKIKPRSAQLLILRQSGLTYAEIAQALSIRFGSVGTLLARAEREFEQSYRQELNE